MQRKPHTTIDKLNTLGHELVEEHLFLASGGLRVLIKRTYIGYPPGLDVCVG